MSTARTMPLVCIVVILGLAACGGGESEPEGTPAGTTEQTQTTAPATTAATTDGDEDASGSGKTKPGTTLALGKTARVTREPLNAPINSNKTFDLDVAVLEIEKGTIDDFANVNLEPEQKQSTPYYATVRVANPGATLPADEDPVLGFDGVDDRGQEQGRVIFIGTFERCDYADVPKPFAKGKSYESCLVFLVPGGGSIEEVRWSGSDEYFSEPVTWK